MKYDLYIMDGPNEGCFIKDIVLKDAATLLNIEECDVEGTIEAYGRCDALFLTTDACATIVPHGSKKPRSWQDRDHPLFDVCPNDNTVS